MADGETTSLRDDLLIGVNAIADSSGERARRAHDGSGARLHLRIIRSGKRRLGPRTPGDRAARPAEILVMEGLDVSITGFSPVEMDQLTVDFEEDTSDPDDAIRSRVDHGRSGERSLRRRRDQALASLFCKGFA